MLWQFLAALLVLVAFVSGAYPAFYVSALQPVHIFRGAHERSSRRVFMHGFLMLQFMLAFITMSAGVTFVLNGLYDTDRDWGYDQTHAHSVEIVDQSQYDVLHSIALQQPSVESVSGSRDHVGREATFGNTEIDGKLVETMGFAVEPSHPPGALRPRRQEQLPLSLDAGRARRGRPCGGGDGGGLEAACARPAIPAPPPGGGLRLLLTGRCGASPVYSPSWR